MAIEQELRSPDGKVHVYCVHNGNVFIWWSYTDDNSYGHIIVLEQECLGNILILLRDKSYSGQLFNQSAKFPLELCISGDEVSFRTLNNYQRLEGSLGRTEFLEFLTAVQIRGNESPQSPQPSP